MLGIPKDPQGQKKFLLGALPIIALIGYYQFYHSSKVQPVVDELQTRYDDLDQRNQAARAQANPQQFQQLQQTLSLYDTHLKRLEELIPAREEVPQLLLDITSRARDSGVDPALLRPISEEAGQFYTQQIYEMRVVGAYHAVGRFLSQIGSLPRIVTPSDVRITLPGNPQAREAGLRLQADFKISTYIIPPPPASADTAARPAAPPATTG